MEEELFNLGLNSLIEENNQNAIEYFTKALQKNPEYSDAYLYRGCTYFKFGDYTAAISDFNQAEKLKEDKFQVYYNRAKAHYFNQDYNSGAADLNMAKESQNLTQEQIEKLNELSNRFS
jgi:tetratricopeptide (TPR) repeat protein